MKLEQQVCSLDLAKRLKELGVKQESYFFWERSSEIGSYRICGGEESNMHNEIIDETGIGMYVAAFTVAELGEMLPGMIDIGGVAHQIVMNKGLLGRMWYTAFSNLTVDKRNIHNDIQEAVTEADARAKMLIYLLENKLITL